ncbi:hypothetical protein BDP81DRAFT_455298 [Colletotrichum phormii]|uniref:Uncharacterized protein n=1 Tax=Colletotrichum phormii TaxID=359342 RepID=A0AAI9ZDG6_9PEZI|nr:uncharacterized protein BDP81DRAFT_455298 [Colletotrichum phormii]KAK1622493.1 hypothetical protein BDP81DRAFT_455298 [Colletotrichum phormii]
MAPALLTSLPYELLLIIAEKLVEDDVFPSYKTECTYETSAGELDRYWRISHQLEENLSAMRDEGIYRPDNGASLARLAKAGNRRLSEACYEAFYRMPISGRGIIKIWDTLECFNSAYQNKIEHLKTLRGYKASLELNLARRKGPCIDATSNNFAKAVSLKLQNLRSLDIKYIGFPHLPQLVEAHFYKCIFLYPSQKDIFKHMPSLKVLVNEGSYFMDVEGAEAALRDSEYDGLPNLAATVETIEFTVGMEDPDIEAAFKEDSVEGLLDLITLMEESCQREWRKVRLIDITMLTVCYGCASLTWPGVDKSDFLAECLQLIEDAKKRFQREPGIKLLI